MFKETITWNTGAPIETGKFYLIEHSLGVSYAYYVKNKLITGCDEAVFLLPTLLGTIKLPSVIAWTELPHGIKPYTVEELNNSIPKDIDDFADDVLKVMEQDVEDYATDDSLDSMRLKVWVQEIRKKLEDKPISEQRLNNKRFRFYESCPAVKLIPQEVRVSRIIENLEDYHKFIKGEEN